MIRIVLCIFMALSVASGAMASVYEVHEKSNQEARSLDVLTEHADHNDVSTSDNCADHCINHCGIWQHLMNDACSNVIVLNPQVNTVEHQWYFVLLSENDFNSQLLRPPSLLS
ncbi:MAG: hypothetical protein ACN6I6_00635 [bacterium]